TRACADDRPRDGRRAASRRRLSRGGGRGARARPVDADVRRLVVVWVVAGMVRSGQVFRGGARLLVRDLAQLATPAAGTTPRRGAELAAVDVVDDAFVLCAGDRIEAVGRMRDLPSIEGELAELDGRGLCA